MSAIDRLNQIEARASAATKGPTLDRYHHGGGRLAIFDNNNRVLVADFYNEEDREFYTAARTDVPALVAALRAVLEVHAPDPYCGNFHHNPHRCPCAIPACADGCDTYPCPTVRAIEEALNA